MTTKTLLTASAVFLAVLGIVCTFIPQELLGFMGIDAPDEVVLLVQIIGALYLGFATLNWMLRSTPMGGIYGRPLGMSNFLHFVVAGIPILRAGLTDGQSPVIWILAGGYALLALGFGWVLFTGSPARKEAAV